MDIFYFILLGFIAYMLVKLFYKFDKYMMYINDTVSFDEHLKLSEKQLNLERKFNNHLKDKNEKLHQ